MADRKTPIPGATSGVWAFDEVRDEPLLKFGFAGLKRRVWGTGIGMDFAFSLLTALPYLKLLGVESWDGRLPILRLLAAVYLIKTAAWFGLLQWLWSPIERLAKEARAGSVADETVTRATEAAYRSPILFTIVFAGIWGVLYPAVTLGLPLVADRSLLWGGRAMIGVAVFSVALSTGALALTLPLAQTLLARLAGLMSLTVREHGLTIPGAGLPLRYRVIVIAICLAAAPICWMASSGYMSELRATSRAGADRARLLTAELAQELAERLSTGAVDRSILRELLSTHEGDLVSPFVAPVDGKLLVSQSAIHLPVDDEIRRWLDQSVRDARFGLRTDNERGSSVAYRHVGGKYVVGAVVQAPGATAAPALFTLLFFFLATAIFAPLCARYLAMTLAYPLEKINAAFALLARADAPRNIRIPAYFKDELGMLAHNANSLVAWVQAERTRSRNLLEVLEEKNQGLVRGAETRSQFLANMSHELRTPLNAILGFSRILARKAVGRLDDQQMNNVRLIHESGQQLLKLVNDLLDMERIDAGRLQMTTAQVDCDELSSYMQATLGPEAEKKGLKLVTDVVDPPLLIRSDPDRLRQIVTNFLQNAIRYSEEGTITLKVTRRLEGDKEGLEFSVQDEGLGIPLDKQERIFEAFYQLEDTKGRHDGAGLGLAIVKKLANMLGGHVGVESQVGRGSRFWLRLPPRVLQRPAAPVRPLPPTGTGPVVLVVDDNPAMLEIIRTELTDAGFRVHTATGGREGLERAHQLKPDAIVLDIVMPGMDGWQVLRAIRRDPATTAIPVIVSSVLDDHPHGVDLGIAAWLTKPIQPEEFRKVMARLLRDNRDDVLVVEDDAATRSLLEQELTALNLKVRATVDGATAMSALEDRIPDALILDLMLPGGQDGFEVLQRLRRMPGGECTPVIVYTGKQLTEDETERLYKSFVEVISKEQDTSVVDLAGRLQLALDRRELNERSAVS